MIVIDIVIADQLLNIILNIVVTRSVKPLVNIISIVIEDVIVIVIGGG